MSHDTRFLFRVGNFPLVVKICEPQAARGRAYSFSRNAVKVTLTPRDGISLTRLEVFVDPHRNPRRIAHQPSCQPALRLHGIADASGTPTNLSTEFCDGTEAS